MLRVTPAASAASAKSYYSHADYLAEGQDHAGVWRGKLAARLGLAGVVDQADFDALCDNLRPDGIGPLTPRTDARRTVGYDFNFHAPKSLSVLHALTGDDRLLAAFQDAVDDAMTRIEADAQTRVRAGGRAEDRATGELLWARFDHLTARPVDGLPDPHLHAHCFVLNATYDPAEGRIKAGQFRELKRDAPFHQAAFHADLAARVAALGYGVERTAQGWEVAGVSREVIDAFSRRTRQVEAAAAEKGITDPDAKAALGALTREGKAKHLSMAELRSEWAGRLTADDTATLRGLAAAATPRAVHADLAAAREALDFACRHRFERQAVVPERTLLADALAAGVGRVQLADLAAAVRDSDVLVRAVGDRRWATTRAVLAEEEKLIHFARAGRGTSTPLGPAGHRLQRDWLSADQRAAVEHVLTSPDRVILVRGAAGTGKTTLMQEAAAGIAAGGKRVIAVAPTAAAGRGVLRQEGFATADTLARLLVDPALQESARGQVVWVDEAGLVGSRTAARLFALTDALDCRLVLAGDRRQHGPVERGGLLGVLEDQAGLRSAAVTEIQRQQGAYKAAVAHLSAGRVGAGFDALAALGWVHEVADPAARYAAVAAVYAADVAAGRSVLVVSPTHAEGAAATAHIRSALRAAGRLTGPDVAVPVLVPLHLTEAERGRVDRYRRGDVLQFQQNARGHRIGDRVTVGAGPLPLDQAGRFQAFRPAVLPLAAGDRVRVTKGGKTTDGHRLETGQTFAVAGVGSAGDITLTNGWVVGAGFRHLAHGYVSTSHSSQGRTVDHVIVAQSAASAGAASREQFYVSASRGRHRLTVFTDNTAALRDAVARSDEPPSAAVLFPAPPADRRDRGRRLRRLDRGRAAARDPAREHPAPAVPREAAYDR